MIYKKRVCPKNVVIEELINQLILYIYIYQLTFFLISVYLHDQRYVLRADPRKYDDLRGEWAYRPRIRDAHDFIAKYRTRERGRASWRRRFQRRKSRTSIVRLVILARLFAASF